MQIFIFFAQRTVPIHKLLVESYKQLAYGTTQFMIPQGSCGSRSRVQLRLSKGAKITVDTPTFMVSRDALVTHYQGRGLRDHSMPPCMGLKGNK